MAESSKRTVEIPRPGPAVATKRDVVAGGQRSGELLEQYAGEANAVNGADLVHSNIQAETSKALFDGPADTEKKYQGFRAGIQKLPATAAEPQKSAEAQKSPDLGTFVLGLYHSLIAGIGLAAFVVAGRTLVVARNLSLPSLRTWSGSRASSASALPSRLAPNVQGSQLAVFMVEPNLNVSPGGFNASGEAPIEIRGFSLAKAILIVGLGLTVASFAEFFLSEGGGSGLGSLGFIYGLPVTLIGCSLAYAELAPAGVRSTPALDDLFETKGTETMKKIYQDVTRHRYGDEAHLDTTIKALGLVLPQKAYPQMQYLDFQNAAGGELSMMCVFESLDTPFRIWAEPEKVAKYDVFFGPDLWCETVKVSGEEKLVGIRMTTGAKPAPAPVEVPASAPVAEATEAAGAKPVPVVLSA
jgi:hypothetical protein